jgi:ubiquitin-protein ligase
MSVLPRSFKLLEEIDNEPKYNGIISYGLKRADDIELREFTGMVIDNNGNISTFEIVCSDEYPKKPPTVKLINTSNRKIYDHFENSMLKKTCEVINGWKETSCIGDILLYLQKRA